MSKIASVETDVVRTDAFGGVDVVRFRVADGDGVQGSAYVWVLAGTPGSPSAADLVELSARHLEPLVVGRGTFDHEALYADLNERTLALLTAGGPTAFAHAGIDMAMWDLACRTAGQPLWQLLGGRTDRSPTYCSVFLPADATAADTIAAVRAELARGFRAVKIGPQLDPDRPGAVVELVAEVRSALPSDVGLRLDAVSWWLVGSAPLDLIVRTCHRLDDLGLDWIEDPLPVGELALFARLCADLRTPVATGENVFSHEVFRTMLARRSCDVAIVDPMRVGGVTGWLRVARLAAAAGVPVAPHGYGELGAHLVAATPNGLVVEHLPGVATGLLDHGPELVEGAVLAPRRVGAGMEMAGATVRPGADEADRP